MKEIRLESFDLNLLVTLRAVLETRSVRRAAARLGVTQSAVSHALRRLRDVVDDPLVVPTRDGVVPTPMLERISGALERALGDLESALRDARAFDPATARRTFQIASADLAESLVLPSFARQLQHRSPFVRLSVRAPGAGDLDDLEDRLDLAIGVYPALPAGLRRRLLCEDTFVGVLRRGHPARSGALTAQRWLELSHVVVAPRGGTTLVDRALEERGLARKVAVEVPHFHVAPMIVAESDLVLTFPRTLALRWASFLPLEIVELPFELAPFTLHAVWHERVQDDPGHAWLREQLVASLEDGSSHG